MSEGLEQYQVRNEPYYRAVSDEVELYEAAYSVRMPMMLKGPTGCGKTRFVEYMAWKLNKPLITVACNEDMTASDLVGRFLLDATGTRWQDGPLALAARHGAICYLDEVVEARQDTTVVIHPLTDNRRVLPLEKKGELVQAHADFQIVISYNLGYQLYREVRAALEGHMTAATLDQLTGELSRYASTVGWAEGVIDKDGHITEAFDQLRATAKTLFEQTGEADMATLHDALADFILAIRSHDADMKPSSDSDDDYLD